MQQLHIPYNAENLTRWGKISFSTRAPLQRDRYFVSFVLRQTTSAKATWMYGLWQYGQHSIEPRPGASTRKDGLRIERRGNRAFPDLANVGYYLSTAIVLCFITNDPLPPQPPIPAPQPVVLKMVKWGKKRYKSVAVKVNLFLKDFCLSLPLCRCLSGTSFKTLRSPDATTLREIQ
jgi:hypothetical protein